MHAVEADPRMLAVLRRLHPNAYGHHATADRLPLPDNSVDAVLSADAWHWFPIQEAIAEAMRVMRTGGRLGLVWNVVTPVESWEYDLAHVDPDQKGAARDPEDKPNEGGTPFPRRETVTRVFPWVWEITPEHYRGFLATNSGVMTLPPAERLAVLEAAEGIVARACGALGRATAPMHHQAYCVRWQPF